jgi:hypothetical protein
MIYTGSNISWCHNVKGDRVNGSTGNGSFLRITISFKKKLRIHRLIRAEANKSKKVVHLNLLLAGGQQ